jgi:hypothetical protein
LRLTAFIFLTNIQNSAFSAIHPANGLKKPFFQAIARERLLWIDCCALS